jgi:hypothetical protein
LFAKQKIEIKEDTEVWAQIYSNDQIEQKGSVFGLVYTSSGLEFEKNSSYLEGALFVKRILKPKSKFEKGAMNLNHSFPLHYFSGIHYQVVSHSLREI